MLNLEKDLVAVGKKEDLLPRGHSDGGCLLETGGRVGLQQGPSQGAGYLLPRVFFRIRPAFPVSAGLSKAM